MKQLKSLKPTIPIDESKILVVKFKDLLNKKLIIKGNQDPNSKRQSSQLKLEQIISDKKPPLKNEKVPQININRKNISPMREKNEPIFTPYKY